MSESHRGAVPIGLREVVPDWAAAARKKGAAAAGSPLLTLRIGATQSTLTPMPLPEGAGGFVYSHRAPNRFIEWTTTGDVLRLTETSLDERLDGNSVRIRFADAPILSGGVGVHETFNSVVVLAATVGSVHKIVFPHPERLRRQFGDASPSASSPSIFAEANIVTAKEHCHVLQTTGTTPMPHLAASYYSVHLDEAYFTLANSLGNVFIVKMGNLKGMVSVNTLKTGSYLGRLLGNFGGILSRGGGDASVGSSGGGVGGGVAAEAVVSLAVHPIGNDTYVLGLCKDHKVRMWSATTFDCVMVEDVLAFTGTARNGGGRGTPLVQGPQSHAMRKVLLDEHGKKFAVAMFLCFSQHSQFCILRPHMVDGQFTLDHTATVYAPEFDLVDFQATPSHLWALWTNPDGHAVLRFATFNTGTADPSTGWNNVHLDTTALFHDEVNGPIHHLHDPRQAYLQRIFFPGRFSVETLSKAVSIYRRTVQNSADQAPSIARMRDEICSAVEAEIQNEVVEYEISDEEYVEVSNAAWARMYSVALQYHQSGLKPMGLMVDAVGRSGLVAILKKSSVSFVRPLDALEHLSLCGDSGAAVGPEIFHDTPILCEDAALCQDVINLMKAVSFVESLISPELVQEFSHGLSRLSSPDVVARQIIKAVLTSDDENDMVRGMNLTQELSTRLQQVCDVSKALEVLLVSLELDRGIVSHSAEDIMCGIHVGECDFRRVFSGPLGISVIAESLNQTVKTRFALTRNLILLQLLMLECGLSQSVSPDTANRIDSTFLPRSVVMAHCHYILVWIAGTCATAPPDNSVEQGLRRMAVLRIASSNQHSSGDAHAQARAIASRPVTLSELFLQGGGGALSRSLLTPDTNAASSWSSVLVPLVNISAQLLWPRCAVPAYQQFLVAASQHAQVQEYVRLLSTWCDWNCHSRQFILGSALLHMGEPDKASDWMIKAAAGISAQSDQFLLMQLFSREEIEGMDADKLTVLYFLKVIQLFEQSGHYDYVIELAKTAIDICNPEDENRATLCYILFSHHLKLGHNDEAYDAMIVNPDKARRKDSLRQFVVALFDRRQLRQLASYPYIDMFDDLEHIIEERARSVDLNANRYYDFLYSFHVSKDNYRKAAHIMFECGMRLATEVFNAEGLKRQAKCYLACLNSLSLVNEKYAWIVKPNLRAAAARTADEIPSLALGPGVSPKRNFEGEEVSPSRAPKLKMEVLEKAQIEREFELVSARLKLTKRSRSSQSALSAVTGPGLSANETVSLLTASNLYEDAVHIGRIFELDHRPVLEGLASRCVWLAKSAGAVERDAAWDWLAENSPSGVDIRAGSAVEAAWKLLQCLLGRLEEGRQSKLHRAVAERLFSQGAYLPSWLVNSYKINNAAELMHVYISHGYLEDAARLACEYISAVLGTGKEYFGLENSLNPHNAPVWLPYNTIDVILLELRDHQHDDKVYKQLHEELNAKVDHYLATAKRVSEDMVQLRRVS